MLDGQRGDIDVDPPDFPATALGCIDRLDRVEDEIEVVVGIGFARHQQEALVALLDEDLGFGGDFRPAQDARA